MNQLAKSGIKSIEMTVVILNADGTVKKDLGVVGYNHQNRLVALWVNWKRRVKKWLQS